MNHTERIHEVARRQRQLTRRLVKEAIESYLQLLAEEIAGGEWVDLYGIGKIRIASEVGSGMVIPKGRTIPTIVTRRLRTQVRLFEVFKRACYRKQIHPS